MRLRPPLEEGVRETLPPGQYAFTITSAKIEALDNPKLEDDRDEPSRLVVGMSIQPGQIVDGKEVKGGFPDSFYLYVRSMFALTRFLLAVQYIRKEEGRLVLCSTGEPYEGFDVQEDGSVPELIGLEGIAAIGLEEGKTYDAEGQLVGTGEMRNMVQGYYPKTI